MSVNDLIAEGMSLFKSNNFDQAIVRFNQAWSEIKDKNFSFQAQSNIQFWLGRCYLEQAMKVKDITEAKDLFAQAIMHYQQQFELAQQLKDKQVSIQEQSSTQVWIGISYLEQAREVKDIAEAKSLFAQAIAHFQHFFELAQQLKDKQVSIQEQRRAQFWLGRCYLEQAMKVKDITEAKDLFAEAIMHHQQQLELARQLKDEQASIQEQHSAQFWIGHCYLEQAMEVKDIAEAKDLFAQAIAHFQQRFELAQQLNKQVSIQEQSSAQSWLGRCYLSLAMKVEDFAERMDLSTQAIVHFRQQLEFAEQLDDEHGRKKHKKIAYSNLMKAYFLGGKTSLYFTTKKQEINKALFSNEDNFLDKKLKDAISTILAVLHIPPIELGSTPLAHYTSSAVCNKLFGVVNGDDPSPMRIGSSTYMNDPSEGKGLLELLALQELELENKADCSSHNAFFACFSSRVNDLNQFRLYGKEDGVEASGACLVFNKDGNWLKESDISAPFRDLIKNMDENSAEFKEINISNVEYENLPLYQVAYIAYKDEYIAEEKCERWLDNSFGICLKPIGGNEDWHNFRLDQLKEALQDLIGFFKEKYHANDKNKNALEYIRYLFKDFAFRDEEEFRVLKIAEIGSEEIKYCETTQSIYLPYADISNVVDEVILGTNYEKTNSRRKAEVFQHQMRQKCPNVKVSRSSLPIYANPPIKKD